MSYSSEAVLFYGVPVPDDADISAIEEATDGPKGIHLVSYGNGLSGSQHALALKSFQTDIYSLKSIDPEKLRFTPEDDQRLKDFCKQMNLPYKQPRCYLTGSYS